MKRDEVYRRRRLMAVALLVLGVVALVFAVFVNDVPLPPAGSGAREGKAIGTLCEILHRHAP